MSVTFLCDVSKGYFLEGGWCPTVALDWVIEDDPEDYVRVKVPSIWSSSGENEIITNIVVLNRSSLKIQVYHFPYIVTFLPPVTTVAADLGFRARLFLYVSLQLFSFDDLRFSNNSVSILLHKRIFVFSRYSKFSYCRKEITDDVRSVKRFVNRI